MKLSSAKQIIKQKKRENHDSELWGSIDSIRVNNSDQTITVYSELSEGLHITIKPEDYEYEQSMLSDISYQLYAKDELEDELEDVKTFSQVYHEEHKGEYDTPKKQYDPEPLGQIWEECERCGCEPVYIPLMLCLDCWPQR